MIYYYKIDKKPILKGSVNFLLSIKSVKSFLKCYWKYFWTHTYYLSQRNFYTINCSSLINEGNFSDIFWIMRFLVSYCWACGCPSLGSRKAEGKSCLFNREVLATTIVSNIWLRQSFILEIRKRTGLAGWRWGLTTRN